MASLNDIAKRAGVRGDAATELFAAIFSAVKDGETVRIQGFGNFTVKTYPGRTLTSPAVNDGKPIKFGDSKMLKFRQSALAKQKLNTKDDTKKELKKVKAKAVEAEEAESDDEDDEDEAPKKKAKAGAKLTKKAAPAAKKKPAAKPAKKAKPEPEDEPDDEDEEPSDDEDEDDDE